MPFTTLHSNRVETLASRLIVRLAECPLPDPLALEWVLVDNRVLGDWLNLQMAQQQGIAANLHHIQPHELFWRIARAVLGEQAVPTQTPLAKEEMTWKLYGLLNDSRLLKQKALAPVANYLAGEETQREQKQFQLAQSVADLFDQYLVYRPEWMLAWAAGESVGDKISDKTSAEWQALLWQQLCESSNHRAAVEAQLLRALDQVTRVRLPLQRLSVFGMTAMPPKLVEMLMLLGQHIDVAVYVLNPCEHHWFDIQSEKQLLRLSRKKSLQHQNYDIGNPLLASQGTQVREFIQCLYNNLDRFPMEDDEAFDDPGDDTLLHSVQQEILTLSYQGQIASLKPLEEMVPRRPLPVAESAAVQSIRFHDCHSPLREVEVLHDQLLALFRHDATLKPRDVVVMMPQVTSYVPYLHSVFGATEQHLPYHISDRSWREEVPLLETFSLLLALPTSRLPLSEVLALLEVSAVQQRFGMDRDGYEILKQWLVEAGARWGLDAQHREQEGLPAYSEFSWEFAINRMLAGMATGVQSDNKNAAEAVVLADALPVIPLSAIEGGNTALLDGFLQFWQSLQRYREQFRQPASASEWATLLNTLIGDFFGELDDAERQAIREIRRCIDSLQKASLWYEGPLPLSVIQQVLQPALEKPAAVRQHWREGIKFCSLLPMRGVPFRVVYMLGMNQDSYPRRIEKKSFDLMVQAHRPGDRATRTDDRWLFLEALLSARDALHISYVGRDERKNEKREVSVVVAELQDYLRRGYAVEIAQLTTVHRLQPFSRDYFAADAHPAQKLFSFNARAYTIAAAEKNTDAVDSGWKVSSAESMEAVEVSLESFIRFFTDPVRWYFRDRHRTSLRQQDDGVSDEELMQVEGGLASWEMKQNLLQWVDPRVDEASVVAQAVSVLEKHYRASARWPLGMAGEQLSAKLVNEVSSDWLLARHTHTAGRTALVSHGHHRFTSSAGTLLVEGSFTHYGDLLFEHSASKFKTASRLAFAIRCAFAALVSTQVAQGTAVFFDRTLQLQTLPDRNHTAFLQVLAELYLRYREQGLPLHPEVSLPEAVDGLQDADQWRKAIHNAWDADYQEYKRIINNSESLAYYLCRERLEDPAFFAVACTINDALATFIGEREPSQVKP